MKNNRIVAIDIGNSSTNLALFEADALIEYDFFPSAPEYCDKICHTIENWQSNFHHIVIGSVVPSLGDMLETRIKEHHNTTPMMVEDFKTKLVPPESGSSRNGRRRSNRQFVRRHTPFRNAPPLS